MKTYMEIVTAEMKKLYEKKKEKYAEYENIGGKGLVRDMLVADYRDTKLYFSKKHLPCLTDEEAEPIVLANIEECIEIAKTETARKVKARTEYDYGMFGYLIMTSQWATLDVKCKMHVMRKAADKIAYGAE